MSEITSSTRSGAPFGAALPRRAEAVRPHQLYASLYNEPEDSLGELASAHALVHALLEAAEPPRTAPDAAPAAFVEALVTWARAQLRPFAGGGYAHSWPARVVREFAPTGLADGAWLSGAVLAPVSPPAAARAQRAAYALRAGAGSTGEPHGHRYAALLVSLGIPPHAIARWEFDETIPCADVSYENALLGLSLGLFPSELGAEILGYELWFAQVGPCPLLTTLQEELALRSAQLRYFEAHDPARLGALAARAVCDALEAAPADAAALRDRIARGFAAAHASYLRWERGMIAGNVPYTPRDFVLEGVRRKARFAAEHHSKVEVHGHNVETLLLQGGDAHEALLDHMATSLSLIRPGAPDRSPLMTQALSLDGPMFDAFTPEEKNDLREWIASLGREEPVPPRDPVALVGRYEPPVEIAALSAATRAHYEALSLPALGACLLHADAHPGVRDYVRGLLDQVLAASPDDAAPSGYGGAALAALLDAPADPEPAAAAAASRARRGFFDVRRAHFEEYAALRNLDLQQAEEAPALLPVDSAAEVFALALSLHARRFMPALLGFSLWAERAARAARPEAWPSARSASAAAVAAFLERVKAGAPDDVAPRWHTIARLAAHAPRLVEDFAAAHANARS